MSGWTSAKEERKATRETAKTVVAIQNQLRGMRPAKRGPPLHEDCWHSSWFKRWFTNHPGPGEDPCLHLVEDENIGFNEHREDWECERCPRMGPLSYLLPVGTSAPEWRTLSKEERERRDDEAFKPFRAEWALRAFIEEMMLKSHAALLAGGRAEEALARTGAAMHARDAFDAVRAGDAKMALAEVEAAEERLREAEVRA